MPTELDERIVKVSIQINDVIKTYTSPLNIVARGTKYGNALQNSAEITLSNLDKNTQDYLLTETSPFTLNRTPKIVMLEAGRVSTGTALVYKGNITNTNISQPPDLSITLKCLTGNFLKGSVISRSQPGQATYKQIAQQVAQDTNTILNFEAQDKNIGNYAFSGGALKQVDDLNLQGNYNAFIDDDILIVKDALVPLNGSLRVLNLETGMIGIPEFTEQGIKVKMLFDNQTRVGGGLRIKSTIYPAINGDYVIYKLSFEIASRDTPFYYVAEAARRR